MDEGKKRFICLMLKLKIKIMIKVFVGWILVLLKEFVKLEKDLKNFRY